MRLLVQINKYFFLLKSLSNLMMMIIIFRYHLVVWQYSYQLILQFISHNILRPWHL